MADRPTEATSRPDDRCEVGRRGEDVASAFLKRRGHDIVTRRFRTRRGELDLVSQSGRHLYFVEVKTRRAREGEGRFGDGFEAVTWKRRRTMHTLARTLMARRPALFDLIPHYAVLSVEELPGRHRVRFLPDAFDGPA